MNAAIQMKRPIHKSVFDAAAEIGERELRVLKAVDNARPRPAYAFELAKMVDLNWDRRPGYWHNNSMAFDRLVRFANVLSRLGSLLASNGWELRRTGCSTGDLVWIVEQTGSPD